MIQTRLTGFAFLCALCALVSSITAGTINLNDIYNGGAPFMSDNYMFLDVEETNGAPADPAFNHYQDPLVVGDTLAFNPTNFRVEVVPGPGADLLDSQLEMIIMGKNGAPITELSYSESGDFEVIGVNPGDSSVSVELNWFWQVLEGPSAGATNSGTESFSAGATPNDSGKWTLGFSDPIPAGSTKVRFEFDNRLTGIANTETSAAFIAKKLIDGVTVTVPEPSSMLLACFGLLALARRR